MRIGPKVIICSVLFTIPFLFDFQKEAEASLDTFHTEAERQYFGLKGDTDLPTGFNSLFAASGECIQCHGFDTAGIASVDLFGNDVNVTDDWRATMMANSAKDPFWRAKVSHEVLVYPQHQTAIETKCTSCHAPLGHFAAFHDGMDSYSMAELANDPIALDGVSCLACHQQSTEDLGDLHSGELNFDSSRVAYGPYTSPLASPMISNSMYEPVYSEHISDAGICAGCHTLLTETIDLAGGLTGSTFVEQATYHEWLNSDYNVQNVSCQNCHMPALSKGMFQIAAGYETEPRSPFYLHELAGANTFMLKLFRDNITELGLSATPQQFDEILNATQDILLYNTLELNLTSTGQSPDSAFFELEVHNLAGHKFPSGYPSRRAFIQFIAVAENGDTLFYSGRLNSDFEVEGLDAGYEPHHDLINDEDQIQIYELVVGDVNGDPTTVLVRGDHPLKDNRLPPVGFTKSHEVYDTTRIAGLALADNDFNQDGAIEGTGSDFVRYHIPLNGFTGQMTAWARILYQVVPPRWMEEMFDEQTFEIDSFKDLFDSADRSPFLVKETSLEIDVTTGIGNVHADPEFIEIFPINGSPGLYRVLSEKSHKIQIFDIAGKKLRNLSQISGSYLLDLHGYTGMLILLFEGPDGQIQVERVHSL